MPKAKNPESPAITRQIVEDLMFGTGQVRRYTQDSPVLPDVWLKYLEAGLDTTDRRVQVG